MQMSSIFLSVMVNMDACIEMNETHNLYHGGYTNLNPFLYI